MTDFTDDYVNLLIKQYYDKPNASGEISMKATQWEIVKDVFDKFPLIRDVNSTDSAVNLDLIGRIVGLSRNQPDSLDDETYRKLLRVKIAKNNASGFMVSDDKISIQDVIDVAFDGLALVTDNMDMSLGMYIDTTEVTVELIRLILYADLLPKPQGVRYLISANNSGETPFGMSELNQPDDDTILGLSELNYLPDNGGELAELYGS